MKKVIHFFIVLTILSTYSCSKEKQDIKEDSTYRIKISAPSEETGKINYTVKLQKKVSENTMEDVKIISDGQYDQKATGKLMDEIVIKDVPQNYYIYASASYNLEYLTIEVKKNDKEIFNKTDKNIKFLYQNL